MALNPPALPDSPARLKSFVRGAVQGVGFRPFVYRLATDLGLKGWVQNSPAGVELEVEGPPPALTSFLLRLAADKPPLSAIHSLESTWLDPVGYQDFQIRETVDTGQKITLVLPDIATCADCLRDISDPANRRYHYPFTNCTHCGPRFSIIHALPYDRVNTSMRGFTMCADCQVEYNSVGDRRFHAQPNACPQCGPRLELWDQSGATLATGDSALNSAAEAIRAGRIVALKGVGGFHLLVDARDEAAVVQLRHRKQREEKPFAVMFPNLEPVKMTCAVNEQETRLLLSPEAPIVLLRALKEGSSSLRLAPSLAPANPYLGVLLPYSPVHYLLLAELGFPVVATSGNLSEEPICIDEFEAVRRLRGIADLFLVHNRPIVRHVDDSVARVVLDRELVLRRARGFAPLPVPIPISSQTGRDQKSPVVLAVGAHLKNSVALAVGDQVFTSQHIGDLENEQAYEAFRRVAADLPMLYDAPPEIVAADLHPDYLSSRFAAGTGLPVQGVQHHYAHVLACMAENQLSPPVLGVSWDGTGYGTDGTVWGGEFLLVNEEGYDRVAHFREFQLPGGDRAVKEPRRSALGLIYEVFGSSLFGRTDLPLLSVFTVQELAMLRIVLEQRTEAPRTTSVGRLFDAVAALVGLRQRVRHEGQAAAELEFAADACPKFTGGCYPLPTAPGPAGTNVIDWEPMVRQILADVNRGLDRGLIAAKFHHSLAQVIVTIAQTLVVPKVTLSGGCFQNRYLTEAVVPLLRQAGFSAYWHQRVPPNDGGISLGQVAAVLRRRKQ